MTETHRTLPYDTTPIQPEDLKCGFKCGTPPLDEFFARHALPNDRAGIGKTYVLRAQSGVADVPDILGFYTLSMADVEPESVAGTVPVRLPRYPMPVALLGRLAAHQEAQGQGVGKRLLRDALRRIANVAGQIGCLGVVVDAKDEAAQGFYARFGFVTLPGADWPRRMFLPMETLRAAL